MKKNQDKMIVFTGRRQYMGTYEGPIHDKVKQLLTNSLTEAIRAGFQTFIAGGALGSDMNAAEVVIGLRKSWAHHINIITMLPYKHRYGSRWPKNSQKRLSHILENSEVRYATEGGYSREALMSRNTAMLALGDVVIAIWEGEMNGGTWDTIRKANRLDYPILVIDPNTSFVYWYNQGKETAR